MPYTGLDPNRAAALSATLRSAARGIDAVQHQLSAAMAQGDMPVPVAGPLDEVESGYRLLGRAIDRARVEILTYCIQLSGMKIDEPAVGPGTAWNQVRQDSSHNSFTVEGGIGDLYQAGVRSFELDIHRGAPTGFAPEPSMLGRKYPWLSIAIDHFSHGGGRPGDWRVFHSSFDAESEYQYLSDGLRAVAELPARETITVFIDVKDPFVGLHTATKLDSLLRAELGDRLYSPAELMDRAPGAVSVYQAVELAGWPTVADLEGKIIVVLTGQTATYEPPLPASFIAPAPVFDRSDGKTVHVPDPNAIFYNVSSMAASIEELQALHENDVIIRTYFNAECAVNPLVNYRAVDVDVADTSCLSLQIERRAD